MMITMLAVLLALIVLALSLVLYALIRQQGRILLRIDALEVDVGRARDSHATRPVSQAAAASAIHGLDVGTTIPAFHVQDLTGRQIRSEDFRGNQLLLIHWNPACSFCRLVVPDLRTRREDLLARNVHLLLVAQGSADENRRLAEDERLDYPIVLARDPGWNVDIFHKLGTPVAYLVNAEGSVTRRVIVGADNLSDVVHELATNAIQVDDGAEQTRKRLPGERAISESRLERHGLRAGTPAPPFTLSDIHERVVSLSYYRGRRVLLVFSDPRCGPCDELAPYLAQVHQQHRDDGLALLMVSRGDIDENRRKADQFGIEFPIALQQRWELSKEYGIFATPVGFLIDERGIIMQDVAKGPQEILMLARNALAVARM